MKLNDKKDDVWTKRSQNSINRTGTKTQVTPKELPQGAAQAATKKQGPAPEAGGKEDDGDSKPHRPWVSPPWKNTPAMLQPQPQKAAEGKPHRTPTWETMGEEPPGKAQRKSHSAL